MTTGPAIKGQHVRTLAPHLPLRVTIGAAPSRPASDAAERVWDDARHLNPRLFNGPILGVLDSEPDCAVIRAERRTFKDLLTAEATGDACTILSVTGLLVGHNAQGKPHVLLGRRSAETRVYPGQWEFAPSGGLTPPAPDLHELGLAHVLAQLRDEGLEELGLDLNTLPGTAFEPVALCLDELARSDDIVVRVTLPGTLDPNRLPCRVNDNSAWEYLDTAWVPLEKLAEFDRASPDAIIPPTRAIWRWLGWV